MLRRAAPLAALFAGSLAAQYGTPPKASEQDYPVHTRADKLAIGAEYLVHSFSGGQESFIARGYLVVEVALFPDKGENLAVNTSQFALRVNGHKQAIAAEGAEFVAASLKYPDWDTRQCHPCTEATAGPVIFGAPAPVGRFPGDPRAAPGRVPRAPDDNAAGIEKQPPVKPDELALQTALQEGEHHAPVSGYLFFPYQGKSSRIHKLELDYTGAAATTTLALM